MDPVDIHVSVYLDRVVDEGAEIDFGRVAERAGTEGRIAVFGGALSIDDMEAAWLPKTNVLAATDTGIVGNCNKFTVQTAFTTGLIVTHEVAPVADYSDYEAIGFLIKTDTAIAAGALQAAQDHAAIGPSQGALLKPPLHLLNPLMPLRRVGDGELHRRAPCQECAYILPRSDLLVVHVSHHG